MTFAVDNDFLHRVKVLIPFPFKIFYLHISLDTKFLFRSGQNVYMCYLFPGFILSRHKSCHLKTDLKGPLGRVRFKAPLRSGLSE